MSQQSLSNISYVTGDILNDPGCKVITMNCLGVGGKGLALQFKQLEPEHFAEYQQLCKEGKYHPGRPRLTKDNKYILFPTKYNWRYPSRYYWIQWGLQAIAKNASLFKDGIAIPPLGCGNGKLDWVRVERMIHRYLGDLDVPVRVYAPLSHK